MMKYIPVLRSFLSRVPGRVHDRMFAVACSLLLPLSTMCKVCNMLRGMALGIVLGVVATLAIVLPFASSICRWIR